jgi:uncharacterized lipoprotein YmbA
MRLLMILVALWLTAFAVSAQDAPSTPTLTAADKLLLAADDDAERLFRVAAMKIPEAIHFQKVRAATEAAFREKGLTLEQARKLLTP